MTSPNYNFELDIEDIDLIESCLSNRIKVLSDRRWTHPTESKDIDVETKKVHELLGKIHWQKVWYRPKKDYVGG